MQVMHFSTWSPSLPVYLAAIFAIVCALQTGSRGWVALAGFVIGILFEFKPFAWVVLMGGLGASTIFAGGDWPARRRYVATIVAGIFCSSPFIWGAATLDPADRRTRLVIDFFMLPRRMLIKIDLTRQFLRAAQNLAPTPSLRTPIFVLLATVVFLLVGIGVRWLGAPAMWRAIRAKGNGDAAAWRLLGVDRRRRCRGAVRADDRSIRRHPAVLSRRVVRDVDLHRPTGSSSSHGVVRQLARSRSRQRSSRRFLRRATISPGNGRSSSVRRAWR